MRDPGQAGHPPTRRFRSSCGFTAFLPLFGFDIVSLEEASMPTPLSILFRMMLCCADADTGILRHGAYSASQIAALTSARTSSLGRPASITMAGVPLQSSRHTSSARR